MNSTNKFNRLSLILLILMCFLYNEAAKGIFVNAATMSQNTSKLILIDPGHGGMDGGAVSRNGIMEKDINLFISLKVKDKLKSRGYGVLMTREEDKGLHTKSNDINSMKVQDLNKRCELKKKSNCDVFISIHQNFFPQSSCHGAQIWHSKNEASRKFAHILQENLKSDLGNNKREEKEAKGAYKILRCYSNIPSVIVECGFLTNPEEERKLSSDVYQNEVAEAIVKAIDEYFQSE